MEHHPAASTFHRLASYPGDIRETCRGFLAEARHGIRAAYAADGWLHQGAFLLILAIAIAIRAWFADALNCVRQLWRWLLSLVAVDGGLAYVILLAIILCGAAFRVYFAVTRPMWYDESQTFLLYASRPFATALSIYSAPNNHLLNTALIRVSYLILGVHPWAIRLPALLAGISLIPLSFAAARRVYNVAAGLVTASLVAAASHLIEYSAEARGYSFVAMFFLIELWLADRLRGEWNTSAALALAVAGALSIYAIPTGLYGVIVIFAWLGLSLIIERRQPLSARLIRDALLSSVLMIALTLALYAPVLIRTGVHAVVANGVVAPHPWGEFVAVNSARLAETWNTWHDALPEAVMLVLLLSFVIGLVMHSRLATGQIPVALVAAVILPLVLLVQRATPFPRVWSFLQPLYFATAAGGMCYIAGMAFRRFGGRLSATLKNTLVAAPLAASLVFMAAVYQKQSTNLWDLNEIQREGEEIGRYIGAQIRPDDTILTWGTDYPSIRYYITQYYGFSVAESYINWTEIAQHQAIPNRAYIVLIRHGEQLESSPQETLAMRALNPDNYSLSPEPAAVFGDVVIFIAYRRL